MSARAKVEAINTLFRATLAGGYDGAKPWAAVKQLRTKGNRYIFEKAASWCVSTNPHKRARGADVLCQLRGPMTAAIKSSSKFASPLPIFVHQSVKIISNLLEKETDLRVIESALFALGHLYQESVVPLLITFANHPSEYVRHAMTFALGCFSRNPKAVQALSKLTSDTDPDVRDWATFAIGTQSDADSPELREALFQRLTDPSSKVREEAIAGLAKRKDTRAVVPLFKLMRAGSYPMHLYQDFEALVKDEPHGETRWGTEDFIDALYVRFPDLLLPRM